MMFDLTPANGRLTEWFPLERGGAQRRGVLARVGCLYVGALDPDRGVSN